MSEKSCTIGRESMQMWVSEETKKYIRKLAIDLDVSSGEAVEKLIEERRSHVNLKSSNEHS